LDSVAAGFVGLKRGGSGHIRDGGQHKYAGVRRPATRAEWKVKK
jgi:hypothetical protein